MTETQTQNSNSQEDNQVNSSYEKRKAYYRSYYQANRDKIREINRAAVARHRLRHSPEKLHTGFKRTKWNIEASLNKGIYHVKTKSDVVALCGAIRKLGYYAMSYRTTKGFKVLKLEVVK